MDLVKVCLQLIKRGQKLGVLLLFFLMLHVELLRLLDDLLVFALHFFKCLIGFLIHGSKLRLILHIYRLLQLHHVLLEHLLRSRWLRSLLAMSWRMQVRLWLLGKSLLLLWLLSLLNPGFSLARVRAANLVILAVELLLGWARVLVNCLLQSCSGGGLGRVISSFKHSGGLLLHGS